jgi:hypothetical protein
MQYNNHNDDNKAGNVQGFGAQLDLVPDDTPAIAQCQAILNIDIFDKNP